MGKDLRNKELGLGIIQRKDGLYMARFTSKSGKRIALTDYIKNKHLLSENVFLL